MILVFNNRQKTRPVRTVLLKRWTAWFLKEALHPSQIELGVHLVEPREMAHVNETYLQHEGSTDVITFDHGSNPKAPNGPVIFGELFICVADAIDYSKQFRTSWQHEVTRYVVHGCLHLVGYDDLQPDLKRVMKRLENKWMKRLEEEFDLKQLAGSSRKKRG